MVTHITRPFELGHLHCTIPVANTFSVKLWIICGGCLELKSTMWLSFLWDVFPWPYKLSCFHLIYAFPWHAGVLSTVFNRKSIEICTCLSFRLKCAVSQDLLSAVWRSSSSTVLFSQLRKLLHSCTLLWPTSFLADFYTHFFFCNPIALKVTLLGHDLRWLQSTLWLLAEKINGNQLKLQPLRLLCCF